MIGGDHLAIAASRPPRAPHEPGPGEHLPEGDPPDEDERDDPDDENEGERDDPPLHGACPDAKHRSPACGVAGAAFVVTALR